MARTSHSPAAKSNHSSFILGNSLVKKVVGAPDSRCFV